MKNWSLIAETEDKPKRKIPEVGEAFYSKGDPRYIYIRVSDSVGKAIHPTTKDALFYCMDWSGNIFIGCYTNATQTFFDNIVILNVLFKEKE